MWHQSTRAKLSETNLNTWEIRSLNSEASAEFSAPATTMLYQPQTKKPRQPT